MASIQELAIGAAATASLIVQPTDLASSLPDELKLLDAEQHMDAFPAVLATSRLIALLEIAAARVLTPSLAPGEMSVGVSINTSHTKPTAPGENVTAEAKYIGRKGKLFDFEIMASDAAGEIGRGGHERAIVISSKLEGVAEGRKKTVEEESKK